MGDLRIILVGEWEQVESNNYIRRIPLCTPPLTVCCVPQLLPLPLRLHTYSARLQGVPNVGGWWMMAVGTMTIVVLAAETRASNYHQQVLDNHCSLQCTLAWYHQGVSLLFCPWCKGDLLFCPWETWGLYLLGNDNKLKVTTISEGFHCVLLHLLSAVFPSSFPCLCACTPTVQDSRVYQTSEADEWWQWVLWLL